MKSKEKIHQLFGAPTWIQKISGRDVIEKKKLIYEIALSGDFEAIIPLSILMISDSRLHGCCLKAVKNLIRLSGLKNLVSLELRFRTSQWNYNSQWQHLSPKRLVHLINGSKDDALILGLLSFHGNGYIREEAVRLLSQINSGCEIPFLVLRINDWVPQISKLAEESVKKRITKRKMKMMTEIFWLISRLDDQERAQKTDIASEFKNLYYHDFDQIKKDLLTEDFLTRREIIKNFPDELISKELVKICLSDNDCLVRSHALSILERHLSLWPDLVNHMIRSPYQNVRSKAVYFSTGLDDAPEKLKVLAFDKSNRIRESAVFYLNKIQNFNAREEYLSRIPEPFAIEALACHGNTKDIPLIVNLVSSERKKVRRAALTALGHISGDGHEEFFFTCLGSDSDDVVINAVKQLIKIKAAIDPDDLIRRIKTCRKQVLLSLLKLTQNMNKIRKILVLADVYSRVKSESLRSQILVRIERSLDLSNPVYTVTDEERKLKLFLDQNSEIPDPLKYQIRSNIFYTGSGFAT